MRLPCASLGMVRYAAVSDRSNTTRSMARRVTRCRTHNLSKDSLKYGNSSGLCPNGSNRFYLGQLRWFKFALVFMTGIVIGVSLESSKRKSGEKKAFELRSLGYKFRSLSDNIKIRAASSGWPDNARDLRPAISSAFISAKKFDLWVPGERVYELPDASFLYEYFRCVGMLLEDGHLDDACRESLSWKPYLDRANPSIAPPRDLGG
jgi:hypothetical protein